MPLKNRNNNNHNDNIRVKDEGDVLRGGGGGSSREDVRWVVQKDDLGSIGGGGERMRRNGSGVRTLRKRR